MDNLNAKMALKPGKRRSRAKNSSDGSDEDGKKRGRPRVEKQDESAADRRRTQIRMAQRAYRQRKESTLEELRKRVSELNNTVELMNKAFIDCHSRLVTAGLPNEQLQDLQDTLKHYEELMKCARNPADEPDPEIDQSLRGSSKVPTAEDDSRQMPILPKNVPSWIDKSELQAQPRQRLPTEVGMGYTMYAQGEEGMAHATDTFNELDQQLQAIGLPNHQRPHPGSLEAFRADVPEYLTNSMTISPPMTYSFQESTFARRLHRACLEQGYQLLLDPARRPATYSRVFKLCLLLTDRSRLIVGMKTMLDRGPHEELDGNTTMIHVGGAGTHYPRKDAFGRYKAKKESRDLGMIGPKTLALLENAAGANLTSDMTVDIAGFEGEWFDPYDVEGYLNERGVFIDPTSSFAEVEVPVWSPNGSGASGTESTATGATAQTPSGPTQLPEPLRPFDLEQQEFLNKGSITVDEWNDFMTMNLSGVGYSDAGTGSWMNFIQPGEGMKPHIPAESQIHPAPWEGSRSTDFLQGEPNGQLNAFNRPSAPSVYEPRKKVIIVDVAKFVKVLTVTAVCIGRTPGFKRRDVDRALALSSFDAF